MDRNRRGQALVEYAFLMLFAMLPLTLGLAQLSLVLIGKAVVNHAAFSAARAQLVGEDPLLAAQIVCAPVAGTKAPVPGAPIVLPGWGNLPRSEFSVPKTSVQVVQDDADSVTVEVTHDFQLMLPMVDLFFRGSGTPVFASGTDASGTSIMRLVERCTLPRPWTKDADLGLP